MLDRHPRVDLVELEARLRGPVRLAVGLQRPAGHQRAVPDDQAAPSSPATRMPRAGDEEAVEHEAAAGGARDGQLVGLVGLPVQQPQHRRAPARGAQLERLALAQLDGDLLDVHRAVGDLDDRRGAARRPAHALSAWPMRWKGAPSPTR